MISDLSPGDKLSLKGKIFELQKKLNIIDIEQRRDEEYSYKPSIITYDLPKRDNNLLENISKAEIIRKQRKDLLRASVEMHAGEGCTFAPQINSSSRKHNRDDARPAHLRLYQKGSEYVRRGEKRREDCKKYDFDGKKLFTPSINKEKKKGALNSSTGSISVDSSHMVNVSADEFLYQDAKDREERFRLRHLDLRNEAEATASTTKMNPSSHVMLRKKAEREARLIFYYLDTEEKGEIGYEDLRRLVYLLQRHQNLSADKKGQICEIMWSLFGEHNPRGIITFGVFVNICIPILLHNTMNPALTEIIEFLQTVNDDSHPDFAQTLTFRLVDLQTLKPILRTLVNVISKMSDSRIDSINTEKIRSRGNSGSTHNMLNYTSINSVTSKDTPEHFPSSTSITSTISQSSQDFVPKISSYSQKLASRKEKKERELIDKILTLKELKTEKTGSNSKPGEKKTSDDELDGPLPPPSFNPSSGKHHDVLIARGILAKQKQKKLAREIKAKEKKDCTFRPKIKPNPAAALLKTSINTDQNVNKTVSEPINEEEVLEENKENKDKDKEKENELIENTEDEKSVNNTEDEKSVNTSKNEGNSEFEESDFEVPPPPPPANEVSFSEKIYNTLKSFSISDDPDDFLSTGDRLPPRPTFASKPMKYEDLIDSVPQDKIKNIKKISKKEKHKEKEKKENELEKQKDKSSPSRSPLKSVSQSLDEQIKAAVIAGKPLKPVNEGKNSPEKDSPEHQTIYDRLYNLKDRQRKMNAPPSYIAELQSCTFAPQLKAHTHFINHRKAHLATQNIVEGYSKSVDRMRMVNEEKERLKQLEEKQVEIDEENYRKSREIAKKGTIPFRFTLAERRNQQVREKMHKSAPNLIIDVKLSATKTAKIRIWNGDIPRVIAEEFGKIYALDKPAESILCSVIQQSMEQNGVILGEEELNINTDSNFKEEDEDSIIPGMKSPKVQDVQQEVLMNHKKSMMSVAASTGVDVEKEMYEEVAENEDDDDSIPIINPQQGPTAPAGERSHSLYEQALGNRSVQI